MTKKRRERPREIDRDKMSPRSTPLAHSLPRLIQENAPLQARNQLLLMYSSFQTEMPADGRTGITTWLQDRLEEHGMPSLVRFGPRTRPQVFRKDEFVEWFRTLPSSES